MHHLSTFLFLNLRTYRSVQSHEPHQQSSVQLKLEPTSQPDNSILQILLYPLLNILDLLSLSFHSVTLSDLLALYLTQKIVYWLTLLLLLTLFLFSHPSSSLIGQINFLFQKANPSICVSS